MTPSNSGPTLCAGVLEGAQTLFVGTGFLGYMIINGGGPLSLVETLGPISFAWGIAMILVCLTVSLLAVAQENLMAARLEISGRFVLAGLVIGYAIATLASGNLITAGVSLGLGAAQVLRMYKLKHSHIPWLALKAVKEGRE